MNATQPAILTDNDAPAVRWGIMLEGVVAFLYDNRADAEDKLCDLRTVGDRGKLVPVQIRN